VDLGVGGSNPLGHPQFFFSVELELIVDYTYLLYVPSLIYNPRHEPRKNRKSN
jgi:hypothetical protein